MKFVPNKGMVLVKQEEAENQTASGIILPDGVKEKPLQGKVVAIGPDVYAHEIGDIAVFGKYSYVSITIEDKEYLIIKEEELLGAFKEEE